MYRRCEIMRGNVANTIREWRSMRWLLVWLPVIVRVANGEDQDEDEKEGDGPNAKMAYLVEDYAPWCIGAMLAIMLGCYCCYQFQSAAFSRTEEEQDPDEAGKNNGEVKIEQVHNNGGDSGSWAHAVQKKQDFHGVQHLSKRSSDRSVTDRTDRLSVDGSPASSRSGRPSSHGKPPKISAGSSSTVENDIEQQLPSRTEDGDHPSKASALVAEKA